MRDAKPSEVKEHVRALIEGHRALWRRKILSSALGWARAIEVVTSRHDRTLDYAHAHILIVASHDSEDYSRQDWDNIWVKTKAAKFPRRAKVEKVRNPIAVMKYLTKARYEDLRDDALTGIDDPVRYLQRMGYRLDRDGDWDRFSTSGKLTLRVSPDENDPTGLGTLWSPSTRWDWEHQPNRRPPAIPVENGHS
jgi:hypothetical protein